MSFLQDAYAWVSGQSPETLGFLFNHTVKTPIWLLGGAATVIGYGMWRQNRAIKRLKAGEHSGKSAVVSRTEYNDHRDGSFDQKIHTELPDVNLESIFGDELGKTMVTVLQKTKKHITPERPSPFQHLDAVLPYKGITYDVFIKELSRRWQNQMGGILNDSDIYHERYEQHFLRLSDEQHHVETRPISRKEWWQMKFSVDHHMPPQIEIALRHKHGLMPSIDSAPKFG